MREGPLILKTESEKQKLEIITQLRLQLTRRILRFVPQNDKFNQFRTSPLNTFRRSVFLVRGSSWALVLASLTLCQHMAVAAPVVSVSLPPVHSLVSLVMAGVGEPNLLMRSGQSPHTHSLAPSKLREILGSDLVVWVGPSYEPSLSRAVDRVSDNQKVLTLLDEPLINRLPYRSGEDWEGSHHEPHLNHGHDHEKHEKGEHEEDGHEEDGHEEDGHEAESKASSAISFDGHIWLSTENATAIVDLVGLRLKQLDPDNSALYQRNMDTAKATITQLHAELIDHLSGAKNKPYLVFHDAYQYFESEFELFPVGVVAINPERAPSAQTLVHLREKIAVISQRMGKEERICIFREPQFESSAIDVLAENNQLAIGELDPIGAAIEPGSTLWVELMRGLADSLSSCLEGKR